MKRLMKDKQCLGRKLTALCLCGVLTLGLTAPALGAEASLDELDQQAADEAKKILITLEDVDKLARSKGTEVKSARSDLAVAEAAEFNAEMSWYDYRYLAAFSNEAQAAMDAAAETLRTKRTDLRYAETNAEHQGLVAIYNAEQIYLNYLNLQDSLALAKDSLALQQENVKVEKLMVSLGLSTSASLRSKELAAQEQQETIATLEKNLDILGQNLLRQLGMEEDTEFRLDPAVSTEGLEENYEVDRLTEALLSQSAAIKKMDESMDQMRDNIDDSSNTVPVRDVYGAQLDGLKLSKEQMISGFKTLCRSTVQNLETTKNSLPLLENKVSEAQTAYDTTALRLKLGLEAKLNLQAGAVAVKNAQLELVKAERNYYLNLRGTQLLMKGITDHVMGTGTASEA